MARAGIRRGCVAEEAADEALRDGELEDAETLLQEALEVYRLAEDAHRRGRTLLKTGIARMHEDPQDALLLFGQAEALFDPTAEPILAWCTRHHEIWCLNDLGYPADALRILESSRPLYRRFRRLQLVTRQQPWLEARIDLRLGRHQQAEDRLRLIVKMLLADLEHPDDLLLVALDLLRAMAAQEGTRPRMLQILDAFCSLFDNLRLHPLHLAVWIQLRRNVEQGIPEDFDWPAVQYFFRYG